MFSIAMNYNFPLGKTNVVAQSVENVIKESDVIRWGVELKNAKHNPFCESILTVFVCTLDK